jgi:peptidoglycan/xylan/chitin deacetylase (PgdA/CDA1 family)
MITFDIFGEGKTKCVTMSFDDGHIYDIQLVELFNKYGIKGTFHLNSKQFGNKAKFTGRARLSKDEIKELYKGHEISCHGTVHTTMTQMPVQNMALDVLEDRRILEEICGYTFRGMSYPNGAYDKRTIEVLRSCGIEYCRTIKSNGSEFLPDDFLEWHPTCHYSAALELAKRLANNPRYGRMLYIWGHGFEIAEGKYDWDYVEELCKTLASNKEDIWFATNIEIVDFVNAQRSLKISVDNKMIYNPSAIDVWVRADGNPLCIKAGETVTL